MYVINYKWCDTWYLWCYFSVLCSCTHAWVWGCYVSNNYITYFKCRNIQYILMACTWWIVIIKDRYYSPKNYNNIVPQCCWMSECRSEAVSRGAPTMEDWGLVTLLSLSVHFNSWFSGWESLVTRLAKEGLSDVSAFLWVTNQLHLYNYNSSNT